ncbi:MAG: 1-deoxy-D-xylulose-5-phosphate reductoisomerase [Candidatus Schekmanbacteria bacterium]|nr:1-deoxy-D-xylulose-5-phosphate reductoisomerase [Candidatus Schekmanbacteria bacterium]
MPKKRIAILGSTGSIGVNSLDVIRRFPEKYEITGLAANRSAALLVEQAKYFKPKQVALFDEEEAEKIRKKLPSSIKVLSGMEGIIKIATAEQTDLVVSAMVGAAGLLPTYMAIKAGKTIALANKEALVVGGELITREAKKNNVRILPVDSEHSAIFQSMEGHRHKDIKRLILTASGGPFLNVDAAKLKKVTPDDALKHPNWKMGKKITIDSATMMNKGLEAIEARWLFDIDIENISVIIHPESIIHSMVEYIDGSLVAQLGMPDMRVPISFALSYPERLENKYASLDLAKKGTLTFREPDMKKFKCLTLAIKAGKISGTMPAVLNASNEIAVHAFLERKISFTSIADITSKTMDAHTVKKVKTIDDVLNADKWGRKKAKELIDKI